MSKKITVGNHPHKIQSHFIFGIVFLMLIATSLEGWTASDQFSGAAMGRYQIMEEIQEQKRQIRSLNKDFKESLAESSQAVNEALDKLLKAKTSLESAHSTASSEPQKEMSSLSEAKDHSAAIQIAEESYLSALNDYTDKATTFEKQYQEYLNQFAGAYIKMQQLSEKWFTDNKTQNSDDGSSATYETNNQKMRMKGKNLATTIEHLQVLFNQREFANDEETTHEWRTAVACLKNFKGLVKHKTSFRGTGDKTRRYVQDAKFAAKINLYEVRNAMFKSQLRMQDLHNGLILALIGSYSRDNEGLHQFEVKRFDIEAVAFTDLEILSLDMPTPLDNESPHIPEGDGLSDSWFEDGGE